MTPASLLKKLPLALAISAASGAVMAEGQAKELQPLEVWATQISSSSEYLGDNDIQLKQADHLSDLMRMLPGVEVGGTHSVVQKISIRSLDDTDLNITIDGANQQAYVYHHAGNLLINPDILKAVDIQVGANSVLTGGLGGNVAFETKDAIDLLQPGQKVGGRIQGQVASNKYFGTSFTGFGRLGENLDFLAYINQVDRDNPDDGRGRESLGNDGKIMNGLLKAGIALTDEQRLEVAYDHYKDEGDYPFRADMGVGTNQAITKDRLYPTDYQRDTFTVGYELDKGDALYLRANLYHNELALKRREDTEEYAVKEGVTKNIGGKVLAETLLEHATFNQTLRYGGEYNLQKTRMYKDGHNKGGEEAASLALYAEDTLDFDGIRITPGLRYNVYDIDATAADKSYNEWTWGLAAEMDLNSQWTLRAAATRLFQGPNLEEAFYADHVNSTNGALKPETGLNREVGIRFRQQQLAGFDEVNLGLTAFHTSINDRITWSRSGGSWFNQDKVELKGFEASARVEKGSFSALASYSKTDTEDKLTGNPIADQSGDSVSLTVDYTFPQQVTLAWESQWITEEGHYDKPAYNVHSISARWAPKSVKGLELTAGIENIFDEYYVSHVSRIGESNHPRFGHLVLDDSEPGRNIKLTAAYSF